MSETEFVYTTYIATTPERLWQTLTDPAFTRRYLGAELYSDWQVGSPVLWKEGLDEEPRDLGQVVLEATSAAPVLHLGTTRGPTTRRCSAGPRSAWPSAARAALARNVRPRARRRRGQADRHPRRLRAESPMLDAISAAWPQLLANLKTLLETGDTMHHADWPRAAGAEEPQS